MKVFALVLVDVMWGKAIESLVKLRPRLFAAETGDVDELSMQLEFGMNPNAAWRQKHIPPQILSSNQV